MHKLAFVLVAFVAGCGGGGSTVTPSSVPPTGGGSNGSDGMPTPGMPGGAGPGGSGTGTGSGGSGGSGGGSGGGACDLSAATPLVIGVEEMLSIAVDADFVYYTTRGSSPGAAAYRVPKSGGTPMPLVTLPQDTWAEVAVDDSNIYVLARGTSSPAGGVHILTKATGTDRFVQARSLDCDEPHPSHLAIFAGDVYWMQRDAPGACATGIEIDRLPNGSDTPVMLIGADEDSGGGLFVDATHVFWDYGQGIERMNRTGGGVERLDPHSASRFASDGNTLYASFARTVVAVTAPSVDHVAYEDPGVDVSGLAADATHLWIGASHLVRIDLGSGASTVVSDVAAAGPLAVDDRYVYYFDTAHEILKACR